MCGGHGSGEAANVAQMQAQSGPTRCMSLCVDQAEWLERVAKAQSHSSEQTAWHMLERLIGVANREPSQTKRSIFLQVRCHRCLQHSRGGDKRDYDVELSEQRWQWLENVRQRSKHPSLGKTLRILVDFYKPICEKDEEFERAIFKATQSNEGETAQENDSGLRNSADIEDAQGSVQTANIPVRKEPSTQVTDVCDASRSEKLRLQKDLSNIDVNAGYTEVAKLDHAQTQSAMEVKVQ